MKKEGEPRGHDPPFKHEVSKVVIGLIGNSRQVRHCDIHLAQGTFPFLFKGPRFQPPGVISISQLTPTSVPLPAGQLNVPSGAQLETAHRG